MNKSLAIALAPGLLAPSQRSRANSIAWHTIGGVFIGTATALQSQNFTIEAWVNRANTSFVSNDNHNPERREQDYKLGQHPRIILCST